MKQLFEEIGAAALTCVCIIISLSIFSNVITNDLVRDRAIDFESGAEVYTYTSEEVAYGEDGNVKFNVNPIIIDYNNGGEPFKWRDYILKNDPITGNTCYAEFGDYKVADNTELDLSSYVIPKAYIGVFDTDETALAEKLAKIDSKLVNVRRAGTQVIPLLLKWEGVSVEKNMYVTVRPNTVTYTVHGYVNSYGSDYGVRKDQSLVLIAEGEDYAYSLTDDSGYFEFSGLNEEDFTLKATVVSMDAEGNFNESTYAYNIPKSAFDNALIASSSDINIGTVSLSPVNDVRINSINYLLPIGMTWGEFVDLGYSQADGEFIVYDKDGTEIPALYFDAPTSLNVEDHAYVSLDDEIHSGNYSIGVVEKRFIYNNTKEVNYFGIYEEE